MAEDGKKISFSFNKSTKRNTIIKKPSKPSNTQFIECLEDKAIKVINKEEKEAKPLVIPVQQSRGIEDRIKEVREKRKQTTDALDNRPDFELTPDELAARELIKESQNYEANKKSKIVITLPQTTEEKIIIEGKPEPTLEDYENVPVSGYGMAILRGMGWKEGMAIGKNQKKPAKIIEPTFRPLGVGLGANKMANSSKKSQILKDEDGKVLILKAGAYVKINAGHYKGNYCEVQGLDDVGRVIVRTANGVNLSLSEFIVELVTKSEFEKQKLSVNGK